MQHVHNNISAMFPIILHNFSRHECQLLMLSPMWHKTYNFKQNNENMNFSICT